jgi:D-2-hydroxyacid dehydrogenase (NADP+)
MTSTLFISEKIAHQYHEPIAALLESAPYSIEVMLFKPDAQYSSAQINSIRAAFYSRDIWQGTVNNQLSIAAQAFWQHLNHAPNLNWIQILAAGVDHQIYQSTLKRGIQISTSSGTNAEPVGLTAVTGLLMLARGFPHWIRAQQNHHWAPIEPPHLPRDLEGQTAIIIGTGNIGTVIARHLQTMGVRTIGVRRSPGEADFFDQTISLSALDSKLPTCDWLILACPLTDTTRGLIDARRLALLPAGAGLINIARGEIVQEDALIRSLTSKHLLGAYLDVFKVEPLPHDSPLWKLPNVIVTPHNAAASVGNAQRSVERFLKNLDAYLHNKPLESLA